MLEAEWVVYRHTRHPNLIATCPARDWDDWQETVFAHIDGQHAYELLARGLTESEAHQMVRIAVED